MVRLVEREDEREGSRAEEKLAACIIRIDGSIESVYPENGSFFKLEEMQKIVGGYIQVLPCNSGRMMVIDEEGKLKGYACNLLASEIADLEGDYIVGDVLLCSREHLGR